MGLCGTTEWFDFLIHPDCKNHLPTFNTEIARPQYKKLPFMQECLVRLLHNPLPIHVMLTSFLIKFYYVETLTSYAFSFSVIMFLSWMFYAVFCSSFGIADQIWAFCQSEKVITPTSEQHVVSKQNFLIWISAAMHFMLLIEGRNTIVEVLKNEQMDRCPVISVTYVIVILMIQTPLLLCSMQGRRYHRHEYTIVSP